MVFSLLGRNRLGLVLAFGSMVVSTLLLMLMPLWVRHLLASILPQAEMAKLAQNLALGLLLFVSSQLSAYGWELMRLRLSHQSCAQVRRKLFSKILYSQMPFFLGQPSGDIVSRLTADLKVFQDGLFWGVFQFIPSVMALAGLTALMLANSLLVGSLTFILLIPFALAIHWFVMHVHGQSKRAQEKQGRLAHLTEESIRGIKEIKAFGRETHMEKRFGEINDQVLTAQIQQDRYRILHSTLVPVVLFLGLLVLIFFCNWLVSQKQLSQKNLTFYLACLAFSFSPTLKMSYSFGFMSKMVPVLDRFREIWRQPSEPANGRPTLIEPKPVPFQGAIQFRRLHFSYGQEFALRDINCAVAGGETVLLIGANGSGKTTLFHLLLRFLNPTDGSIHIDGIDIRQFPLVALRGQLGYLPQEPVLIEGTIAENIVFAKPSASMEDMRRAAESAHVDEFVHRLAQGYQTPIGPYGCFLSVGQRQRIALARIFLRDPGILLLDEPASAMDQESIASFKDSLQSWPGKRTIMLASHSPKTFLPVERFLFLGQGQLTERAGPEQSLLKGPLPGRP